MNGAPQARKPATHSLRAANHERPVLRMQGPNPSIEGTSNIRLRLLSVAPHVKR